LLTHSKAILQKAIWKRQKLSTGIALVPSFESCLARLIRDRYQAIPFFMRQLARKDFLKRDQAAWKLFRVGARKRSKSVAI